MADKRDVGYTQQSLFGFSNSLTWIVLVKILARVLLQAKVIDYLREKAKKTQNPFDDAVVQALEAFLKAID